MNQTVYGPPEWFAESNVNVDVYGPPEYFEEPDEEEQTAVSYAETTSPDVMYTEMTEVVTPSETTPDKVPEWNAEENVPMLVYGPPEYFQNIESTTTPAYNPDDNNGE